LQKVERWSTLSYKFWLCCSFFIELTTCHVTNAAMLDPHQANQPISALHFFNSQQILLLRNKLRVSVSRISPPLPTGQAMKVKM